MLETYSSQHGLPVCNDSALFANSKLSLKSPKMYCIDNIHWHFMVLLLTGIWCFSWQRWGIVSISDMLLSVRETPASLLTTDCSGFTHITVPLPCRPVLPAAQQVIHFIVFLLN